MRYSSEKKSQAQNSLNLLSGGTPAGIVNARGNFEHFNIIPTDSDQ